jgi:hypothetical protein
MEELSSSETSVVTRATRRNIPEGGSLHSHSREILKSDIDGDKFFSPMNCLSLLSGIFLVLFSVKA